jgi:hypothetical protein
VFVDELDLMALGFEGMQPEVTGRPGYHPASLLKIYIYGYLNRIQSSRRPERETQRNAPQEAFSHILGRENSLNALPQVAHIMAQGTINEFGGDVRGQCQGGLGDRAELLEEAQVCLFGAAVHIKESQDALSDAIPVRPTSEIPIHPNPRCSPH